MERGRVIKESNEVRFYWGYKNIKADIDAEANSLPFPFFLAGRTHYMS